MVIPAGLLVLTKTSRTEGLVMVVEEIPIHGSVEATQGHARNMAPIDAACLCPKTDHRLVRVEIAAFESADIRAAARIQPEFEFSRRAPVTACHTRLPA